MEEDFSPPNEGNEISVFKTSLFQGPDVVEFLTYNSPACGMGMVQRIGRARAAIHLVVNYIALRARGRQ